MKLTESQMKQARKMKVPPEMIVFADLLYLGYSEVEAYQIAYTDDESLSLSMQKRKRKEIISSKKFKELCDQRREQHERELSIPIDNAEIDLISSEEVAKEILLSAKSLPPGSRERAELFIKYYTLVEEEKIYTSVSGDGMGNINYFFSEKCTNNCPLYLIYMKHWLKFIKENKGNGEVVGMDLKPVVQEVSKIIKKVSKL